MNSRPDTQNALKRVASRTSLLKQASEYQRAVYEL